MSAYTELNIKEGMPLAQDAIDQLKTSIDRFRRDRYKCVLVIHGYGSTGRGGIIHDKAHPISLPFSGLSFAFYFGGR